MKHVHQNHGKRDAAEGLYLLLTIAQIQQCPSNETWVQFTELLQIQRTNSGIQFATNKEIVPFISESQDLP